MQKLFIFCLCIGLFCSGCKQPVDRTVVLMDSVMKEHIAIAKLTPYYDTANENYVLLQAYSKRDTVFLKKQLDVLKELMNNAIAIKAAMSKADSCVRPILLSKQGVDEVYRFSYSGYFQVYLLFIDIGIRNHSPSVASTIYYSDRGSGKCSVVETVKKPLSETEWNLLLDELNYADFWALNNKTEINNGDGNEISIEGFKSNNASAEETGNVEITKQTHRVSRPDWYNSAIRKPLLLAYKLSGCNRKYFPDLNKIAASESASIFKGQ